MFMSVPYSIKNDQICLQKEKSIGDYGLQKRNFLHFPYGFVMKDEIRYVI